MNIGIIGAGNVGANITSQLILTNNVKKIALIDIFEDFAKGRALDLSHMASVFNNNVKIVGGSDYNLIKNFDIIVITAGKPRKVGQSRDDLLLENAKVVGECAKELSIQAPNSIIIVVTNPLDLMVYVAKKYSGFNKNKVIGMAGELDSARLRYEISNGLNLNIKDVKADIIGMHGDDMIVLKNEITIKNYNEKIKEDSLEKMVDSTKKSGATINLLSKSSAFFAPAAATVKMINAITNDSDEIMSCCVMDENEIPFGRFVKLGHNGLKEIVKFKYSKNFYTSMQEVKNSIEKLNY